MYVRVYLAIRFICRATVGNQWGLGPKKMDINQKKNIACFFEFSCSWWSETALGTVDLGKSYETIACFFDVGPLRGASTAVFGRLWWNAMVLQWFPQNSK